MSTIQTYNNIIEQMKNAIVSMIKKGQATPHEWWHDSIKFPTNLLEYIPHTHPITGVGIVDNSIRFFGEDSAYMWNVQPHQIPALYFLLVQEMGFDDVPFMCAKKTFIKKEKYDYYV